MAIKVYRVVSNESLGRGETEHGVKEVDAVLDE